MTDLTRGNVSDAGLRCLVVENFRNIVSARVDLAPTLTVISGDNAAGKTSLLEALHVLARARSFQRVPLDRLVRHGAPGLLVHGVVETDTTHRLGLQRADGATRVRLDGGDVRSLSEVAWLLPVQVINTQSQRFLTDGPADRRAFMNWGVFHVEHGFRALWRRYDRALRQRNAALKQQDWRMVAALDPEVSVGGEAMDQARRRFLDALEPHWREQVDRWLPALSLRWSYRRGWRQEEPLADSLKRTATKDRELGYTASGPHRADLRISADGEDAGQRLSRGQQKMAVVALQLALLQLLKSVQRQRPLLLIDDLPAELDEGHRKALLDEAVATGAQIVVTTIDRAAIPVANTACRWFHVEQGVFSEVI
jgi:DNA replication and repair protein RecF